MFKKEKLKEFLAEKELTVKEFGERVGVSDTMVCYLTSGFKQPSAVLLSRIAKEMGVSMEELME